jgi:hypothetical protein
MTRNERRCDRTAISYPTKRHRTPRKYWPSNTPASGSVHPHPHSYQTNWPHRWRLYRRPVQRLSNRRPAKTSTDTVPNCQQPSFSIRIGMAHFVHIGARYEPCLQVSSFTITLVLPYQGINFEIAENFATRRSMVQLKIKMLIHCNKHV